MQLRIGEVARQSGVGIETLRFYESRRLISPATRTEAGYRLYDRSVFDRLAFIKKAQSVGFSLDEIAWIVDEAQQGRRPCAEVRTLAQARLAELDRKLAELKRYRGELQQTLDAWNREGEKDGLICGLIEGLKPGTLHPPHGNSLVTRQATRRRKS
jgi:MerR family Zn(II)-responsive transcriptional regulator of zntA